MNCVQEVVVYRNPFERDFCEFMQDYPEAILWFVGFLVFVGLGLYLWDKFINRRFH